MYSPAEYVWVLIPLGGMGVGAFAIYQGSKSRQKAIELLKVYAEQGKEPPKELLDAVTSNVSRLSGGPSQAVDRINGSRTASWARFVLLSVLAAGFAAVGWWSQALAFPFYITAFCLAAVALSSLVWALAGPRDSDRP